MNMIMLTVLYTLSKVNDQAVNILSRAHCHLGVVSVCLILSNWRR